MRAPLGLMMLGSLQLMACTWAGEDLTALADRVNYTNVYATGNVACGRSSEGKIYCWGGTANLLGTIQVTDTCEVFGDLGGTDYECTKRPLLVWNENDLRFNTMAFGLQHACAIGSDGTTWCWGDNQMGERGSTPVAGQTNAVQVPYRSDLFSDAHPASVVSAGADATCAIAVDGTTWCWGQPSVLTLAGDAVKGAPGCTNGFCVVLPTQVETTSHYVALGVGRSHACGLTGAGAIECWGSDASGQLGDNQMHPNCYDQMPCSPMAVPVAYPGPYVSLTVSDDSTCAAGTDGFLFCWGGGGPKSPMKVPVTGVGPIVESVIINAGNQYECVLDRNGAISCNGAAPNYEVFTKVVSTSHYQHLAMGSGFTCAVTTGGDIDCWGMNSLGQLGTGTTMNSMTPVRVSNPYRD